MYLPNDDIREVGAEVTEFIDDRPEAEPDRGDEPRVSEKPPVTAPDE